MKNICVITGATGGMGIDIAKNFKKDDILVLADLNKEKLDNLVIELKNLGIESYGMVCDISKIDDINSLVNKTKELGHFSTLIHTAGVSESMGDWQKILTINLIGTKLLSDAFYEIADNSTVIHIASMTGRLVPNSKLFDKTLSNPLHPKFLKKMKLFANKPTNAYAFSKKGVIMLVENEVGKWAKKNSRILSISPGAIDTPLSRLEAKNTPAVDILIKNTPIPRYGTVSEITSLINYLCTKEAEFINGTDILIDGGIVSHMKNNDIFKDLK